LRRAEINGFISSVLPLRYIDNIWDNIWVAEGLFADGIAYGLSSLREDKLETIPERPSAGTNTFLCGSFPRDRVRWPNLALRRLPLCIP
jgi:hypothetical protein